MNRVDRDYLPKDYNFKKNVNDHSENMKILFGVFDWGLGHATRDIPIIEELLRRKHTVHILSTGRALSLLRRHFKSRCKYFDVPSIGNPYTKTKMFTVSFAISAPRMIHKLRTAHKTVEQIISEERYDKVISDCRYDVYDNSSNSYLINHQVRFKSFIGSEIVAERWLAKRQMRYRYVLVPDFKDRGLTGDLSHNLKIIDKKKIKYVGVLSFLRKKNLKKDIDYFISISGPEPQRTILEKRIFEQIDGLRGNIVVALGKPETKSFKRRANVKIYGFLNTKQQENAMNRAKCVITRSGYTTMMELYELEVKRALIIPTPGQTEQEYLGKLYEKRKELHCVKQDELDLVRDAEQTRKYKGFKKNWKTKRSVEKFMEIVLADRKVRD